MVAFLLFVACDAGPDKDGPAPHDSADTGGPDHTGDTHETGAGDSVGSVPDSAEDSARDTGGPGSSWGFEEEATAWALPARCGEAPEHCYDVSRSDTLDETFSYLLFDLDGDGALDFVVTTDPADPGVGRAYWLVSFGGSGGFGPESTWTLPAICDGESAYGWPHCGIGLLTGGWLDEAGRQVPYAIVPVDEDGALDFLLLRHEELDADIGRTHWRMWPGQDGGFGDAVDLPLPPRCDDPVATCVDTEALLDVTGDGRIDLVTTLSELDPTLGRTHWAVAPGSDAGFEEEVGWALPGECDGPPDDPWEPGWCSEPDWGNVHDGPGYVVDDLDGDGVSDLSLTRVEAAGLTVGGQLWLLHPGGEAGFDAPRDVALPTRCQDPTSEARVPVCTFGSGWTQDQHGLYYVHTLADMDADGLADFLVTYDEAGDPELSQTRWQVWRGDGTAFAEEHAWRLPSRCADLDSFGLSNCRYYDGHQDLDVVDVDGDGLLDLLQRYDPSVPDPDLGVTRWAVHRGSLTLP